MKPFRLLRPTDAKSAAGAAAKGGTVVKAGGTDLLDRMKERVDEPAQVVSLRDVDPERLRGINAGGGGVVLGGAVTLTQIAASKEVLAVLPALATAADHAASPQIRNVATVAGNLAQHTRCGYYRLKSFACFKRGDDVCPVLGDGAVQENAGIFANRPCACAHPSSLAPVLAAANASLTLLRRGKETQVPVRAFYRAPQLGSPTDTILEPGDLILDIRVPEQFEARTAYEEIRQKAAFDWALVSCAARVAWGDSPDVKPVIAEVSVWLGSVAPSPWRARAAEKALVGSTGIESQIEKAAKAAVADATALPGTSYKLALVEVAVRRALERAVREG